MWKQDQFKLFANSHSKSATGLEWKTDFYVKASVDLSSRFHFKVFIAT